MSNSLDTPIDPNSIKREGPIQVSNVMKDDFDFEIPQESVPLPSRGVIYSQEGPLHGQETIDIKPMTAREEDILTSRAYIKSGTVLTKLLQSCIVNKSIKPDDLISGDRNALLVSLRITGYGADYDVEVDCPECGTKSKQTFDLSQLAIKRLEVDPVIQGENLFEVQLPVTKKTVRVKFLTGHDERDMMITNERKKKSGMKVETAITDRLSRSIVSVSGVTDRNKLNFFVKNIPARDSLALRRFLDKHEPGIVMKSWMTCSHCHEQSEVGLPMGASFFWPDTE
tara:strand:+ start:4067 stop:4915 length:849 start_codon:yes stop_codon:yes gene_type:complete